MGMRMDMWSVALRMGVWWLWGLGHGDRHGDGKGGGNGNVYGVEMGMNMG